MQISNVVSMCLTQLNRNVVNLARVAVDVHLVYLAAHGVMATVWRNVAPENCCGYFLVFCRYLIRGNKHQAPVVQRVDSIIIQKIKYVGKTWYCHTSFIRNEDKSIRIIGLCKYLSNAIRWLLWIVTYPVNKVIQVLNKWGLQGDRISLLIDSNCIDA